MGTGEGIWVTLSCILVAHVWRPTAGLGCASVQHRISARRDDIHADRHTHVYTRSVHYNMIMLTCRYCNFFCTVHDCMQSETRVSFT